MKFEDAYKELYRGIRPSDDLKRRVQTACPRKKPARNWKYAAIAAVCACAFLLVGTPALAAAFPMFQQLLHSLSPSMAQALQPIELSSINNEIEMNVIAADYDGEEAVIYLSMKDLSGKGRIDEMVDLYDYSILSFSDDIVTGTHSPVSYDAQTQTAVLAIRFWGKGLNPNGKTTLFVTSFLSNKETYSSIPLSFGENTLQEAQTTLTVADKDIRGTGLTGSEGDAKFDKYSNLPETIEIPTPQENDLLVDNQLDFFKVCSMGYIDGELHIVTEWWNGVDNHGSIWAVDSGGNETPAFALLYFTDEAGRKYVDFLFDIPMEKADDYQFAGDFVKNGAFVEGDWKVTFDLNKR